MLDKYAEELKQLRLDKNLTLQQVAQYTRIDIKFLEALEDGDFAFQPELYIKAFIKDYIKALDEDPVLYLKKFDYAKQGKVYEEPKAQEPVKKSHLSFRSQPKKEEEPQGTSDTLFPFTKDAASEPEPVQEKEEEDNNHYIEAPIEYPEVNKSEPPKMKVSKTSFNAVSTGPAPIEYNPSGIDKQWIIIGGIGICFVLIIAVYFLFFKGDSRKIITENSYQQELSENSNRYTEPEKTAAVDSTRAVNSDSLVLEISSTQKTWLSMQRDSTRAKDLSLTPGQPVKFTAKYNYTLFTNKAKLLSLTLNGRKLEFTMDGNLAKFQVNKDGVTNIKIFNKSAGSPNAQ